MAKAKKTSVSLMEIDEEIVNELMALRGMSFSAALRFIIRTWRERDGMRFLVTDKGKQALEEREQ